MGALGIGDDDTVIAYDDAGGVIAARLVWMLRGDRPRGGAARRRARRLGRGARHGARRPRPGRLHRRASGPPTASRRSTRPRPPPTGTVVIDARPRERYLGGPDAVDPRAGHIPGARSVPCRENLDEAGRILPTEELRARFGVDDAAEVISYCGSGVTACHNLLAMEQAGLGRGRLFPGSWSQWSRDPARPAETAPAGTP